MDRKKKVIIGAAVAGVAVWAVVGILGVKQFIANSTQNDAKAEDAPTYNFVRESNDYMHIEIDSAGEKVPVPNGYVGSPITEGFTNPAGILTSDGGENTINTGFVIYEKNEGETDEQAKQTISNDPWEAQKTRNQWVWVPVPNPSTIYGTDANGKKWGKLYRFSATSTANVTGTSPYNWSETNGIMRMTSATSTREPDIVKDYDKESQLRTLDLGIRSPQDFLASLEKEFNQSIASIEKYGGFYIGRYETGGLNATAKVVKMNEDISNQTWYTMYAKSKKLKGTNKNTTTSMIFGSQQDRTLMWLIESGNKTKEQIATRDGNRNWGNYGGGIIPSGSEEQVKANNIYDLAGNVLDCRCKWWK